jgi:uncharacterized surface protein with fasciclin (FAS1) repeats
MQGVTVDLPPGFEGRTIGRSQPPAAAAQRAPAAAASQPEKTLSIVHAATVPLPPEVGDFGSNVVEVLGPDDVFVAVFEYDSAVAGTALFSQQGIPRPLDFDAFSPTVLQRSIKGQAGAQRFFTEGGRAFCVYAVLGSDARRSALIDKVNGLLATLQIAPLAAAGGAGPGAQPTSTTTTTVPLRSVAEVIAAQADLRTFTELLDTSGLGPVVAGKGPFTVFAPSDDAFAQIDLAALRADPTALRRTMEYHVVSGDLHVDVLQANQQLPTLAGPSVTIGRNGTAATVDGSMLVRPDLDANNGVVHVIDRMLEPPK